MNYMDIVHQQSSIVCKWKVATQNKNTPFFLKNHNISL